MKTSLKSSFLKTSCAAFFVSSFSLWAADSTWTGTSPGDWDVPGNWSAGIPGVAGTAGTNADIATINQTANTTITLDDPWSLGGIAFTNSNTTTITLQGTGALYLGSGGTISRTGGNAASNAQVNLDLFLSGNYTISSAGSGTTAGYIQIGSAGKTIESAAASGTQTLTLGGSSPNQANTILSSISNGTSGGTVALEKTDAGTWVLNAANNYTGTTTVTGGQLILNTRDSLYNGNAAQWTTGNITVGAGAALIFRLGGPTGFTVSEAESFFGLASPTGGFQAGSFIGLDTTDTGNLTWAPVITDTSNGALGLIKQGTNTLTLNKANSYTGGTIIGALADGTHHGGILHVAASGALGTGTVTIQNGTQSGGTATGGTLQLSNNSTLTNDVTLGFVRSTTTSYHVQNLSGSNSIGTVSISGGASGAQGYRFDSVAGKLTIASFSISTNTSGTWRNLYFTGAGDIAVTGNINQGSGSNTTTRVFKSDSGALALGGGDITYRGQTLISGGTLLLNGVYAPLAMTATEITNSRSGYGDATLGQFQVESGATLGGTGRIKGNTALANSNMVLVKSGGTLAPGDGNTLGSLKLDGATMTGTNNLTLNMAADAKFEFNLAANGSGADTVDFWNYGIGDVLLNNNQINFTLVGPQAGGNYQVDLFRFYSNDGTLLTASGIASGLVLGTYDTDVLSNVSLVYGTNTIQLKYTVIPEPSAWALLAFGGLCLVLRRRLRLG